MRIRWPTRSTWKVRNGETRSAGETTPCCPPPIRSRVSSKVNRSGGDASCHSYLVIFHPFVEQLTCLPYIRTRSGVVFCPPSPRPRSPCHAPSRDGIMSGTCQKVRKLCIYFNRKPLRTKIQTYKHTSTTSDYKTPLAPAALARL